MQPHPDQHYGCHTYSQHGEDLVILNAFTLLGIQKGQYLDIGAHHPKAISNTRLLYERGWSGVNVEANPNLMQALQSYRSRDINIHAAVVPELPADGSNTVQLHMYSDTSGRNTISLDEVNAVADVMPALRGSIAVPAITPNTLVETYCQGRVPEFLSIDAEGMDLSIIEAFDFKKYGHPRLICVETRKTAEATRAMTNFLATSGHRPYIRMGENMLFMHYSDVLTLYEGKRSS